MAINYNIGVNPAGHKLEDYKQRFPQVPEELLIEVVAKGGRLISTYDRTRALAWHGKGMSESTICRKLKISTLTWTKKAFPDFNKLWNKISTGRIKQVETIFEQYLLGSAKETKITYIPKFNALGEMETDEKGKPVLIIKEKVIHQVPPNPSLIIFYLRTKLPSIYNKTPEKATGDILPLDELRKATEKLAKDVLKLG